MSMTPMDGYTRKIDNRRPQLVDNRCTNRGRPICCKAFIKYRNGDYIKTPIGNPYPHICEAQQGIL